MKSIILSFALLIALNGFAQKSTPLPHGMVFGTKPDTTAMLPAYKVEEFMGKRTRISTTLRGMVLKATQSKGGWFNVDAGKGKVIRAHFKNYGITLPTDLKGRIIIMEGVAAKQFIANDMQHMAGDSVVKAKRIKPDPKHKLVFEVKGLVVDK
jgi:hypothetical protein